MDGVPEDVAAAFRPALADAEVDPLANRTDRALAAIKRGILTGGLRPGQQLVEADLAEVLQMSKTPVREALKTLVGSGLVVLSRFKGAVVRELDAEAASAIYDLRLLLEPEAVRRAVANGADVSVAADALDRALAAGESGDTAGMSLANREFHRALYLGCGNPLLISTLDGLKDQTALVSVSGWRSAGGWRAEAGEHRDMLAAAKKGDAVATAAALRDHITGFVERTIPLLTDENREGSSAAG
ncbi:GntR family transcriptional regulator [Amycolatopsis ultiminotia]|uniref:GntR family transcriptional regulator n=1 Tax=Amycolatopsis ultiminotia TaxID=543629 RepID=A0ABP6VFA0_9PSEU